MEQHLAADAGRKRVLTGDDIRRAITRIAHEIIERNHGLDGVVLSVSSAAGVWLARRARRRDRPHRAARCRSGRSMPRSIATTSACGRSSPGRGRARSRSSLEGATVVLVDDVLFTGRTVRAALEAVNEYGRPRAVQLAVLVDRGHRELPIRPDFVGKNLPDARDEEVRVTPDGGSRSGMKHLRSIDRGRDPTAMRRLLDLTDHMAEINRRPIPKVPALRGKTVVQPVLRGLHPHPAVSFETAAKRLSADTMTFSRQALAASTRARACATRSRRSPRWASTRSSSATSSSGVPWQVSALDDGEHHQRRRRLARAPDPGAARLLHRSARRSNRRGGFDGLHIADRRRHQAQPGRPQRRRGVHHARRRRHAGRPADAAPAGGRGWPVDRTTSTR